MNTFVAGTLCLLKSEFYLLTTFIRPWTWPHHQVFELSGTFTKGYPNLLHCKGIFFQTRLCRVSMLNCRMGRGVAVRIRVLSSGVQSRALPTTYNATKVRFVCRLDFRRTTSTLTSTPFLLGVKVGQALWHACATKETLRHMLTDYCSSLWHFEVYVSIIWAVDNKKCKEPSTKNRSPKKQTFILQW